MLRQELEIGQRVSDVIILVGPVSEMTYTVSGGTLNPTQHSCWEWSG